MIKYKGFGIMKLQNSNYIFITAIIGVLIGCISIFYLPDNIPIQWSGFNITRYGPKLMIFLYPAICLALFLLKPMVLAKSKTPWVTNVILIGIVLILQSIQIYTTIYYLGVRWNIEYIVITEIVLLVIAFLIPLLIKKDILDK